MWTVRRRMHSRLRRPFFLQPCCDLAASVPPDAPCACARGLGGRARTAEPCLVGCSEFADRSSMFGVRCSTFDARGAQVKTARSFASESQRDFTKCFRSTSSTAVMLYLEILSRSVNICMLHPKQCMSHDHQSSVVHQLAYLSDTESLTYLGQ